MSKKEAFVAFVVSLGGFLFGFDAGIISGVMEYVSPEFDLSDAQTGWAVSAPSFAAMFTMLIAGRVSDISGRKKMLITVAFLYGFSALLSAYAMSYTMLWIARMIGGVAFGAALILAPIYIAEIASAKSRGKLVSIQQLNIVLGFFAAFLSNYFFNKFNASDASQWLTNQNVWRYMLGVELIPAVLYFILLFFVPKSPRWLLTKNKIDEAKAILSNIHGADKAEIEVNNIVKGLKAENQSGTKVQLKDIFKPALKYVLTVGVIIGILQQIIGINAIYFYATSIFKQTGIGTDASFSSGVLLSFTTVVFTIIAMFLIDKMGRRPLMLIGVFGIATSLLLCAYGFNQATYQLDNDKIAQLNFEGKEKLNVISGQLFDNDVDFKFRMKELLGNKIYKENDGAILESAITMNAILVLIGILGFIACFAFSLGPVMWVMLSELFPNRYRGLAIGFVGFLNGVASWVVQQVFPWELSNLGSTMAFFIFGVIAVLGFFILLKILPETKGKSLEEIEKDLVKA